MQKADHALDLHARQRIADLLSVASCPHQPVRAKPGEVLGQRRLTDVERRAEFVDRTFASVKIAQNHQPAAVGERLQQRFSLRSLRGEVFNFHIAICEYNDKYVKLELRGGDMKVLWVLPLLAVFARGAGAGEFTVKQTEVDDRKAVIATVEPVHQLVARARIGGTIVALSVKEGDLVQGGAEIARVVDQKLALQLQALDSRIKSQQAQRDQAKLDFDRASELMRRGVTTQTQYDQARTALDVADRNLAAMKSDRDVIVQQTAEGAVLAPGAGRVLTVPVSSGRVLMPGETVATIAADQYILRLQLPERHAQFMRAGDKVAMAARGDVGGVAQIGVVRLVYPEIVGGRVIADVDVPGLGDYFVGERTRVYVTTGKRTTMIVPTAAVYQRAGVKFVHLKSGDEIVVQPGDSGPDGVEILAGLRAGDVVLTP